MSLDSHPLREAPGVPDAAGHADDPDYWHALINEKEAGDFLGLSDRAMQKMRQAGGGPRFIRISSRCIRYTRVLLKSYADDRVRESTSGDDQATA